MKKINKIGLFTVLFTLPNLVHAISSELNYVCVSETTVGWKKNEDFLNPSQWSNDKKFVLNPISGQKGVKILESPHIFNYGKKDYKISHVIKRRFYRQYCIESDDYMDCYQERDGAIYIDDRPGLVIYETRPGKIYFSSLHILSPWFKLDSPKTGNIPLLEIGECVEF